MIQWIKDFLEAVGLAVLITYTVMLVVLFYYAYFMGGVVILDVTCFGEAEMEFILVSLVSPLSIYTLRRWVERREGRYG